MQNFPFDPQKLLADMCAISIEAGERIMEIYKKDFNIEYKADKSPVTDADKAADTYINLALAEKYPDVARLSEETADDISRRKNDLCFIVDPIDGTREFVKRNGEFTVNIGLSYKERSVAGVVYVPVTGALYYAFNGIGSFRSTKDTLSKIFAESDKIHVSNTTGKLTVMQSRSHPDKETLTLFEVYKDQISEIKISGSSIKGCMIASGEGDVYYRFGPTYEWDTCAMQAVVENAGGIFLQGDLSEMTYNRENTLNAKGFIIANKKENIWDLDCVLHS
jgi:3'(2'), 5'-bisphosphate nucleotidase